MSESPREIRFAILYLEGDKKRRGREGKEEEKKEKRKGKETGRKRERGR